MSVPTKETHPKEKSLVGAKGKLTLKGYTPGMKVCTRFPPEPSGYLHLGHMKAAMLNDYYAHSNGGQLILRFDDTNPLKESQEYVDNIIRDLKTIGIVADKVSYTSDYFDMLMEYGDKILKMGKAYIDDMDPEEMHKGRMEGIESPNRNNTLEKNLEMWEEMKKGTEKGKKCVMRGKIDMKHKNKALRDPSLWRCIDATHYRTGNKYKVYPLYDFGVSIIDSTEGVTHALRSQEYSDRAPLYDWVVDIFGMRKPIIEVFSRMNFAYVLLSKRNLNLFVQKKLVDGWYDPRFPTIQGLLRRGLTLEAMKEFCLSQGSSKNINLMEMEKIWAINKKVIDPIVPRYNAVLKTGACKVTLDTPQEEEKEVALHKKNESLGTKKMTFGKEAYIDGDDAKSIAANEEVTFMDWGNVIFDKIEGETAAAHLHLDGDFKLTKKKLTWISTKDTVDLELREFDYLITVPKIEEGMELEKYINPKSLEIFQAIGESAMKTLKEGDKIQIQRHGYFRVDKAFDGNKIILNKIPDGTEKGPKVKAEIEVKEKKQKKQTKDDKEDHPNRDLKKEKEAKEKKEQAKAQKKAQEKK
ncbi:glutamyl-tRNA synthetase, cytoplasmic, putative [Entamoeba invadens IP1]|uniref:glutamate--tRNA ligase n=1 Tax=Entamoeba invadens IP1 TaxID=370355 RepID=A0A0A1U5Z6_ENTIV|nr:glutamyl-tRNA synthetase, cytoplasmic, putative [Entamoeba invadens IP1]ELP88300.1 glutamyl-tRNA synthetase, cytoplasmic, putative [Entamoeba invadens IP1]|eukprot:XP_004255071.1 glutamyl-tRNA synthetase, cytoplasmic, putative [Entamoeba invadens IP1]